MRQLFLLFACLCLMCGTCVAQDMTADAEYGITYNVEERIITLPQDQGKWHVAIFGDKEEPRFKEVQAWFETNKHLKNLRSQVNYHTYTSDSTCYKERYGKEIPGLPCVRVQAPDGKVISEFYGEHLPMSPDALYQGIRHDLLGKGAEKRCPIRPRPEPPKPEPAPPVAPPRHYHPSNPMSLVSLGPF